MRDVNPEDKKYFGDIYKQINSKFHRCFYPGESCSETSIRAHSIQNSVVLDLLCEEDHVIMPKGGLNIETGPVLTFEKIGRNKATTFTGLCNKHDSELFDPIDNNDFDSKSIEQLFLLSYRSVLRELHTKMKAAIDVQTQYMKGCELGRFQADTPDEPMIMSTVGLFEAYAFYLYKFKYDTIFLNRNFDEITHQVDFIENISPSIAVSSVFSFIDNMRHVQDRQDPKCISLNIFPSYNGVCIIFSCLKEHEKKLLPFLDKIINAEKHYKLYLISKIVLMYCENFVIAPSFFKSLSESRKELLKDFFMQNIGVVKVDRENSELYLF